jgi:predicted DCC family thiol-disulfide oxidoreductase YuxK
MILVLAGLPGWSWSRIFLLLPRRVRDWAYDRIARNRYRLFGRNESCLVPPRSLLAQVGNGGRVEPGLGFSRTRPNL